MKIDYSVRNLPVEYSMKHFLNEFKNKIHQIKTCLEILNLGVTKFFFNNQRLRLFVLKYTKLLNDHMLNILPDRYAF